MSNPLFLLSTLRDELLRLDFELQEIFLPRYIRQYLDKYSERIFLKNMCSTCKTHIFPTGRQVYRLMHLFPLSNELNGHSLSWEANRSSASPKYFPFYVSQRFLIAFARAQKLPLSWYTSIQSMAFIHFFRTYFNIILPSIPRFSKLSLSFTFAYQILHTSLPKVCNMRRQAPSSCEQRPLNNPRSIINQTYNL